MAYCDIHKNKVVFFNFADTYTTDRASIERTIKFLNETIKDPAKYTISKMVMAYVYNYISGQNGMRVPLHVIEDCEAISKGRDSMEYPYTNDGPSIKKICQAGYSMAKNNLDPTLEPLCDMTNSFAECLHLVEKYKGYNSLGSGGREPTNWYNSNNKTAILFIVNDGKTLTYVDALDVENANDFFNNTTIRLDLPVISVLNALLGNDSLLQQGILAYNGVMLNKRLSKLNKPLMSDVDYNELNQLFNSVNYSILNLYELLKSDVVITEDNSADLIKKLQLLTNSLINNRQKISMELTTLIKNLKDKQYNKKRLKDVFKPLIDKEQVFNNINEYYNTLNKCAKIASKYLKNVRLNAYKVDTSKLKQSDTTNTTNSAAVKKELTPAQKAALERFKNMK